MTDEEWDALTPDERRAEFVRRLRARGVRARYVVSLLTGEAVHYPYPVPFEPADYAGLQ